MNLVDYAFVTLASVLTPRKQRALEPVHKEVTEKDKAALRAAELKRMARGRKALKNAKKGGA